MPAILSKINGAFKGSIVDYIWASKQRKALSVSVIVIILYLIKLRLSKTRVPEIHTRAPPPKKKSKGSVDMIFFKRILGLLKIVVPSWRSKEVLDLSLLTVLLVARTFLSIYISSINGRIVKAIVELNFQLFMRRIFSLALCAVPASFVNSYIEYLVKVIAIEFRERLTHYFHNNYINDKIFYQVSNLDARVPNPDQRLTQDIEKWATSLSNLYSNFTKPLLDIFLFSKRLAELLGWRGPVYCIGWYFIAGAVLRFISPSFGKLTAIEQRLEGDYRACHTDIVHHSEEIAFYRGQDWERNRINTSFNNLINHSKSVQIKRLYMGCFDSMLVKYGAVLVGYAILGLPVFGPGSEEYIKKVGNDPSAITRDYIRNSSLLINLAKAIGRLIVSYKEVQNLAGYTTLVCEMKAVIDDLKKGKYERVLLNQGNEGPDSQKPSIVKINQGELREEGDSIRFENVPIVSPNGDPLVKSMTFEIKKGMNCIVTGPNGCGKSSLFRVLGSLWPLFGGKLIRPTLDNLFYVPQRAYLPAGTLRDQVIYPHSKLQMLRKKLKDSDIVKILESVNLGYLVGREGGLDAVNDWNDVLSGGEKQRIAMGRMFYHKPEFAILDECTSAVSMDVESMLYNNAKELGITLFTVSHRQTLFKHHDYLIRFDGEGNWTFEPLPGK